MDIPIRTRLLSAMFRKIPRTVRGRWRLAKLLIGRDLDVTDVELSTKGGYALLVPSLHEPVAFGVLIEGDYEIETWNLIREYLPKGGTFVDVGANVGVFTLRAADHVGATGRVVAIEASPSVFPYLQHNVRRSGYKNISCVQVAVSEREGREVAFYDAPATSFGMGSMAPQFGSPAKPVIGKTLDGILKETGVDRVDVVKVDVEGFEAAVFRGAVQMLTSTPRPVIVFEFLDWAEGRAGEELGAAQSILLGHEYILRRLLTNGNLGDVLTQPLTAGGAMIVAIPSEAVSQG